MTAPQASRKSWVAKVASEKTKLYFLEHDFPEKGRAFYFLLVDPPKEDAFLKAWKAPGPIAMEQYGKVVASGWGEPEDALKQRMRDEYGAEI